ncbi:hypothetical protein QTN24_07655 [Cupriavidus sp. SZY C1]|uniref:hypothetical protein n=1 Tax=Cupriavidus sp. SZY C1 TaxID=3055037 RepID=UPI0028B45866|nr:hypothetical protein [Cupriavidus sp. SZY C1]MDT6961370.1 hypothetical protein [Cupriavidus sp. SZY C1]
MNPTTPRHATPSAPPGHLDRAAASISALIASTQALAHATQALRTSNLATRLRLAQLNWLPSAGACEQCGGGIGGR